MSLPAPLQANQLGVYRAFVDNYKVAVETADKCCQANVQFAEISEVCVLPRSQGGVGLERLAVLRCGGRVRLNQISAHLPS